MRFIDEIARNTFNQTIEIKKEDIMLNFLDKKISEQKAKDSLYKLF